VEGERREAGGSSRSAQVGNRRSVDGILEDSS
jgi:hypothetical protein